MPGGRGSTTWVGISSIKKSGLPLQPHTIMRPARQSMPHFSVFEDCESLPKEAIEHTMHHIHTMNGACIALGARQLRYGHKLPPQIMHDRSVRRHLAKAVLELPGSAAATRGFFAHPLSTKTLLVFISTHGDNLSEYSRALHMVVCKIRVTMDLLTVNPEENAPESEAWVCADSCNWQVTLM